MPASRGHVTRVPAWDARGVGQLPWQGVACLDVNADATRIVVGTIAPAGDPNVAVLDDKGQVIARYSVGQRWIEGVAQIDNSADVYAISTMPEGKASDFPTVFRCAADITPVSTSLGEGGLPQSIFHYGDHSNHSGTILRSFGRGAAAVSGDQVHWLAVVEADSRMGFPRPANGVTVSLAVASTGEVLVGCAAGPGGDSAAPNLFLLKRGTKKPLWSRPANTKVDPSPALEKGLYGKPTLPDGRREELPQRDEKVWAPLSTAMYVDEAVAKGHADSSVRLIAAADYQGFQRWIRSSATLRDQNYGSRFVPTRPTVTVYDGEGRVVRRFGPEQFPQPQWVDLHFLPGGKQLLASPHHWAARGLAGQSILPADEDARSLFLLDIAGGGVERLEFPDAISDVGVAPAGQIVAGCWDGRVYRLTRQDFSSGKIPAGIEVGGPSLIGVSKAGRLVVAATSGIVRVFDGDGSQQAETDLIRVLPHAEKPWVTKAKAEAIVPGLWNLPGGRVESDLGGQRVIQASQGLILIEGHAGASFEREWAAIQSAGLDPREVKYVLATHEHGDHAPGAYLWRVVTGAQFVCSREMAYTLQHHIPLCSGYGFHPPVPTDLVIDDDTALDLAGQKVVALRLPGHTFGAMGWLFEKDGQRFVATGDLIMPEGVLGYSGSINFSAIDVLNSLRKLDSLRVDSVLPGHGPWGDPNRYIAAGISVGRHVGWGKMPPENPDPYFRITQKNVVVAAWNIDAASADFGDVDQDGRPDVAVVVPADNGTAVQIFLNQGGKFSSKPDLQIAVPQVSNCRKIRLRHLNDDRVPDFMVSGTGTALLISKGPALQYDILSLDMNEGHELRRIDLNGSGKSSMLINRAFGTFQIVSVAADRRPRLESFQPEVSGPYADLSQIDVNRDGRTDLLTSYGKLYLRQTDGRFSPQATQTLTLPDPKDWHFMAIGDFNADRKPDVVLLSYGMRSPQGAVFYNTGRVDEPFHGQATTVLNFADEANPTSKSHPTLYRDTPPVADFDGDGVDDLIIGKGQDNRVLILFGGPDGLAASRSRTIELEYRLHFETGLHAADFNGDGRTDLATFGYTKTGVGASGPPAVYVWMADAK